MTDSPISLEELMRRALIKALDDAGLLPGESPDEVQASGMIATLTRYWGERDDVARQAIAIRRASKVLIEELAKENPGHAADLSYQFGVEVGRLLEKLEHPVSAADAASLVEWKERVESTRRNSDAYKDGLKEVRREAVSYANAYLSLMDGDNAMRMRELCEVVFDHLLRIYPPSDARHKFIPPGKKPEEEIRRWLRGKVPAYVSRRGRPRS